MNFGSLSSVYLPDASCASVVNTSPPLILPLSIAV